MDHLPPELLSHIYAFIPLRTIQTTTLYVNKKHRELSVQRVCKAVSGLHLTLHSDLTEPCFSDMDLQLPLRCSLEKRIKNGTAEILSFIPTTDQRLVHFNRMIEVARIKLIIHEHFEAGCSSDLQPLVNDSMASQMGVLLCEDSLMPDKLFGAQFPTVSEIMNESMQFVSSGAFGKTSSVNLAQSVRHGFHNSIHLDTDHSNVGHSSSESAKVKSRTVGLEWDLFAFSDKSTELGGMLKGVTVPLPAILSSFIKYRPGLSDLDTEDGDSEWSDETNSDGLYDDDSGGYASDY